MGQASQAGFAVKVPKSHNLHAMIDWFQRKGHQAAQIDPLELLKPGTPRESEMEHWELNEYESLDAYPLDYRIGETLQDKCASVQDVHAYLKETYCSTVGVDFEHISDEDERLWCYDNFEKAMHQELTPAEKVKALQLLVRTESMEKFMHKKFATHKRYSSEGSEAITVAINTLIAEASRTESEHELDSVVLGMPHRGRLATLIVLNEYPFRNLLYKAAGKNDVPEEIEDRIDDIPTHIAVSNTKRFSSGHKEHQTKKVTLTMVHNPSHLESQNAISMGKTRAKYDDLGAGTKRAVMNIQAHGDAAFPGQGAAYEALTLSKLPKFTCQGSIHIITNNQLGFTTSPEDDRSFAHAADIVKPFGVPILRVNTADPESVIKACRFMVRYWHKYGKDVLIDMVGYRYYGHNEVDEPSFTQPLMYQKIRSMKSSVEKYADKLIENKVVTAEDIQKLKEQINGHFEAEYLASLGMTPDLKNTRDPSYRGSRSLTHKWSEMQFSQWGSEPEQTGYDSGQLTKIGQASVDLPEGFNVHPRIKKMFIDQRLKALDAGSIDWATAEAMALGSLAFEGYNARMVGEDSERGTFSQRHAVFHDQTTGATYSPLRDSAWMQESRKGRFNVSNTNLCELGSMGYEYGYSLENPRNLCLWEAQFGDFYNPAQLMIDQYLQCSEAKWLRQSGLTLLLPHGFDGAGPEHSTCHMERFLQNINSQAYDTISGDYDNLNAFNINFQVAQPSTPANYFHILRRQMHRNFRKPLIIAAPKIGLKHPRAVSHIEELETGTSFKPLITKSYGEGKPTKIVLCSGKIGFDIEAVLEKEDLAGRHAVKVIKVEEIAPFPVHQLKDHLDQSSGASVYWVQEESLNQGAFQFAKLHVDRLLQALNFENSQMRYIGRSSVHSFCTGAANEHKRQGEQLWQEFADEILK